MAIDWAWVRKELMEKERIRSSKGRGKGDPMAARAEECLKKAEGLVRPKIVSIEKPVMAIEAGHIRIEPDTAFSGRRLSSYLKGARRLNIFVATIGGWLEDEASRLMKAGEELDGYLLDRIGSFAVESLAQNFEEGLRRRYAGKGESVSMRFSPGYCDWPIEEQRKLASVVDLSKAGVRLTESCMMIPRKSISAIVGIGPGRSFSKKRSQCVVCKLSDCSYRRVS